ILISFIFFQLLPRPPTSTLFPYTTLFRSQPRASAGPPSGKKRPAPGRSRGFGPGSRRAGGARGGPERARSAVPSDPIARGPKWEDRKSTRLNSSHEWISYAVFCLKKKKKI